MKLSSGMLCCVLLVACGGSSGIDPDSEVSSHDTDLISNSTEVGIRCSGVTDGVTRTLTVDVGLVMDTALYQQIGDLAKAKAAAAEMLREADSLYANALCGSSRPAVRLRLAQLQIFTDGDPWTVSPTETGVVRPQDLRDSFAAWSAVHFNDNDVRHLLTALRFDRGLGIANLASVCTAKAASISRPVYSPSQANWIPTQSRTVAHEIGHTLGLFHDGLASILCRLGCAENYELFADMSGCDRNDYIMGPGGNVWTGEFSECSRYQLQVLATHGQVNRLGSYDGVAGCLLEEASACGDDPNAECNPTDPCCDSNCRLIERSQGVVCRPKAHGECDIAETCDGYHADCPADEYEPAGSTCEQGAGRCFEGECGNYENACSQFDNSFFTYSACPERQTGDPCGDLWCIKPPLQICGRMRDPDHYGSYLQVPDGTPCSSNGGQCVAGVCTRM